MPKFPRLVLWSLAGVASSAGLALGQAEKATTIHVVVVETHDRLTPTPKPGIVKRHEIDVVLEPNKQIRETQRNSDVTGPRAHEDPGAERSTSLGESGKFVWHVLGPNKLQRMGARNQQLLVVWTIEIEANHKCAIDAKYLMQNGRAFITDTIAGTDIAANFDNYRVQSATCTIE